MSDRGRLHVYHDYDYMTRLNLKPPTLWKQQLCCNCTFLHLWSITACYRLNFYLWLWFNTCKWLMYIGSIKSRLPLMPPVKKLDLLQVVLCNWEEYYGGLNWATFGCNFFSHNFYIYHNRNSTNFRTFYETMTYYEMFWYILYTFSTIFT